MFACFASGFWRGPVPLLALFLALGSWNSALAEGSDSPVVQVAEEWELVIAIPDYDSNGPQVTTCISPAATTDGLYANFEINHESQPEYEAGGLQLQIWDGETHVGSHRFPNHDLMNTPRETVKWTQVMAWGENGLTFEITQGESTTWGNFGGTGHLKRSVATSLANLNGYAPETSVRHSGVAYAGNRVSRLVLKKVTRTLQDGTTLVDDTARVVHECSAD